MRTLCILFGLSAAIGCANSDDDKRELSPYIDNDQDGFPETTDCNDKNPSIHPDSIEMCDEVDNDCDGEIDEDDAFDAPAWFADVDGDGFGAVEDTKNGCEAPAGYTDLMTDCDDLNSASHPGATEMCDAVDNDCDGVIDEGTAYDALEWYRDNDNDGYGSFYENLMACEQPEGYVCVVQEATEHNPCADRCDNDLDGLTDLQDPDCDADGDGVLDEDIGQILAGTHASIQPQDIREGETKWWDMNNSEAIDGGADWDCVDTNPTRSPGLTEQCDIEGIDENCNFLVNDEDTELGLEVDGQTRWFLDADVDGFGDQAASLKACEQPEGMVDNKDDCDDTEPLVNPNNAEVCADEIDNDCDTLVDEDDAPSPLNWYTDSDEDGFGDLTSPCGLSCSQPADDCVADANDCDDGDDTRYPTATEVWYNGVDEDCDGNDSDADGDGYDGEDAGGDDCHDDDTYANPGSPEVCGNEKDDDCDGETDPCTMDAIIYGTSDGDRFGGAVAMGGDLNDDGVGDLVVGASRYNGDGLSKGAAYVYYGPLEDTIEAVGADVILSGESDHDRAGVSVEIVGDTNDDGYADLLVGAYVEDAGGDGAGAAYFLSGPIGGASLEGSLMSLGDSDVKLVGEIGGDYAGFSLSGAGDINDDGYADVLIGAYTASPGLRSEAGAAYILFGPIDDSLDELEDGELDLSYSNVIIMGASAGDQLSYSMDGVGDVDGVDLDGDSFGDVLFGAPNTMSGGAYTGAAFLVLGSDAMEGNIDLADDSDGIFIGVNSADQAGYSVAGIGDIDGDGYGDFAIGAPGYDGGGSDSGGVFIVLGSADIACSGGSDCEETALASASSILVGERNDDYVGVSIDGGSDLNGDDVPDLVVGARLEDSTGSDAGASYIMFGPFDSGVVDMSISDGKFNGGQSNFWLGAAVSMGMDVTDDGVDDMVLGAPRLNETRDGKVDTEAEPPETGLERGAAMIVAGGGWLP